MVDDDLGRLLAAVGNNEAKALLLAAMQPDRLYTAGELHQVMLARQGPVRTWPLRASVVFDYCAHALAPCDLVAEERFAAHRATVGFRKTPYGQTCGDALVGHLLAFSESCESLSLGQLLGKSTLPRTAAHGPGVVPSADQPATSRRYRLLQTLATAALPCRETDLADALGDTAARIEPHLRGLSRCGVITYTTKHLGDSYVWYRLVSPDLTLLPPPLRGRRQLTRQAWEVLCHTGHEPVSGDVVVQQLLTRYPERATQDRASLKATTATVLSYLARLGLVERGRLRATKQSEVTMTAQQRAIVQRLCALCEAYAGKAPRFLADGRATAAAIVGDQRRFRALLTKARAASTNANRHSVDDVSAVVVAMLEHTPNCTLAEIHDAMTEEYDLFLSVERLKQVVALLRRQGTIAVSLTGRPLRYRLAARLPPS